MRQDPDFFEDDELQLIYVAKKLKDALALEEALDHAKIDYLVEPDKYSGGIIFRTERVGAFFYVAPPTLEAAHQVILEKGWQPYKP